MGFESFVLPVLIALTVFGVVGVSFYFTSQAQVQAGAVCPIEPCQENFTAQFQLDSRNEANALIFRKVSLRVDQNCTVPDGTYRTIDCSYDRNYTVVSTNTPIEVLGVQSNAVSLTPLNQQVDIIMPDPLPDFADPNSVFRANCWATQAGSNAFDLNAPVRTRNTLTDTVFLDSTKPFACSEIIEVQ